MSRDIIFLIGYMGCGKSSLGRILAETTGKQLIDIDQYIEQQEGKSIGLLFESLGELGFRKLEQQALHKAGQMNGSIISTGGGAPCHLDNMEYMLNQGIVVYLECSVEKLMDRLKQGRKKRPLIQDKNDHELQTFIKNHLAERQPIYEKAHICFNAEQLECAEEINKAASRLNTILTTTNTLPLNGRIFEQPL